MHGNNKVICSLNRGAQKKPQQLEPSELQESKFLLILNIVILTMILDDFYI